jgi:hypothetical protein
MGNLANTTTTPPVSPGYVTLPIPGAEKELVGPPPPEPGEENDPFRFGWRYLRQIGPDGSENFEQVPLSWDDLLYPEEEDFVVQKPPHVRDFIYLHDALKTFHTPVPGVVVLGDCRVDFGVAGVRPLGPDVLVLFDVHEWLQEGTFHVAEEGGRPIVALEVASPNTRGHDLYNKPDLYFRAGVHKYVVIDRGPRGKNPPSLLGFQRGSRGWVPLAPDTRGRLDLSPVGVQLALEGDRPWLYNTATGERLPDLTEAVQARNAEAKARAEAEVRARDAEVRARDAEVRACDAEVRARDAEAKARAETEKRQALEVRLRQLEAQVSRLSGPE